MSTPLVDPLELVGLEFVLPCEIVEDESPELCGKPGSWVMRSVECCEAADTVTIVCDECRTEFVLGPAGLRCDYCQEPCIVTSLDPL